MKSVWIQRLVEVGSAHNWTTYLASSACGRLVRVEEHTRDLEKWVLIFAISEQCACLSILGFGNYECLQHCLHPNGTWTLQGQVYLVAWKSLLVLRSM